MLCLQQVNIVIVVKCSKKIGMKQETFEVVCWPEIQFLFGKEGFEQNAYLINDEKGLADFGSSAYFVNSDWLRLHT